MINGFCTLPTKRWLKRKLLAKDSGTENAEHGNLHGT